MWWTYLRIDAVFVRAEVFPVPLAEKTFRGITRNFVVIYVKIYQQGNRVSFQLYIHNLSIPPNLGFLFS